MIGSLAIVLAILIVGGRATDEVRAEQIRSILTRMPDSDANAYYQQLRRRVRKIAVMRAVAVLSLICVFYAFRRNLADRRVPAPAPATQQTPAP